MEDDRLTKVFYAAVNPDGTHGELQKLGEAVNIDINKIHEEFEDEFRGFVSLGGEGTFEATFSITMASNIIEYMMYTDHLINELKSFVRTIPSGCFVLLAHPDDVKWIRLSFSELRRLGMYSLTPTALVEKGTVYAMRLDPLYTASMHDAVTSFCGTRADMSVFDDYVCKESPEQLKTALDISAIKKRIKHCKNPMERKVLEKELNTAYFEKKKRRRKK